MQARALAMSHLSFIALIPSSQMRFYAELKLAGSEEQKL
jgi:hypothetical protein